MSAIKIKLEPCGWCRKKAYLVKDLNLVRCSNKECPISSGQRAMSPDEWNERTSEALDWLMELDAEAMASDLVADVEIDEERLMKRFMKSIKFQIGLAKKGYQD